jgi:hypothetical protein
MANPNAAGEVITKCCSDFIPLVTKSEVVVESVAASAGAIGVAFALNW